MITSNVITRVFRIRVGSRTATAFALDVDSKQYLITARHVVGDFSDDAPLELFRGGSWLALPSSIIGHAEGEVDISVLAPPIRLAPALPLEASTGGIIYGQDVHFLGFPYDISTIDLPGEAKLPLPLVKKATVSAFFDSVFLLDGHNNPGFSGGPVVYTPSGQGKNHIRVAAVISGFRSVNQRIQLNGEPTDLILPENTGIIVAHDIRFAIDIIRANPGGLSLPEPIAVAEAP